MPVKIAGMIGTQKEGVAVHLIKGKISREFVIDFTRLHEQWDYDSVLVGAPGNTSCLVGTTEQVAAAVLQYYRLGIHSFLLRGFENPQDTIAIGRDLIPLIRAGAVEIDQQVEAAE